MIRETIEFKFENEEQQRRFHERLNGNWKPKDFTARDVLTFLYGECTEWHEDVDGDEGRVFINHTVRIRNGLLDELLDMAGIKRARYDESALEALKRANEEDVAADAVCEQKLRELGDAARINS